MFKFYEFTEPELQYFRDTCNFTDEERECFELRSKNWSNVKIADTMHISTAKVSILVKRIKTKILKVV